MKRALLGLALCAILLTPSVVAVRDVPAYPDPLRALAPAVLAKVASFEANASGKAWYPGARTFLDRARAEAAEGRFHATLYDAETYQEIVLGHQLQEETNATGGTPADMRLHVIDRAKAWRAESNASFDAFRQHLHAEEGSIRSLQALETSLFAASLAVESKLSDSNFDAYVQQFARTGDVSFDYLVLFARLTRTTSLDLAVAEDILKAGFEQDGIPPPFLAPAWTNITSAALAPTEGTPPPAQERLEAMAAPARANGEGTLAVAIALAEQRTNRFTNMQTIFGDGKSRGKDVVGDADRSFQKQLNNTTADAARARGLQGIFIVDATDRAVFTQTVVEQGAADLGLVLSAWSGLDHANYASGVLASVSPIVPPPAKKSPDAALPLALLGIVSVALVVGRRTR